MVTLNGLVKRVSIVHSIGVLRKKHDNLLSEQESSGVRLTAGRTVLGYTSFTSTTNKFVKSRFLNVRPLHFISNLRHSLCVSRRLTTDGFSPFVRKDILLVFFCPPCIGYITQVSGWSKENGQKGWGEVRDPNSLSLSFHNYIDSNFKNVHVFNSEILVLL